MAKKPSRAGRIRRVFRTLALAGVVAVGAVGYVVYREVSEDLPPVDQLLNYRPPTTTQVFAEDGTMLGEFYVERRYLVPLDQVPNHVRLAFLAAEDADFYRHPGIDPFGIVRALFANLASKRVVQGGSTITQQVVKALLLTPDRNIERKVKEAILSLRLENKLSKDDILYLYLNQIYFGAGAYGVQAAARTFFDVDVGDLTIAQAAMLAGMPQRPTENDPQKHPHAARARQHYVLDRMLHEKFITDEEYQEALAEDIDVQPPHRSTTTYAAAPWYVEHVRRLLEERYGGTAAAQLGLRVHTAVDLQLQSMAEESLQRGLRVLDRRQGFRGAVRRLPAHKIDAFLKHEAKTASPDSHTKYAVVTDVRSTGLLVRTAWEETEIPARSLGWGGRHLMPSAFRPGDIVAITLDDAAKEIRDLEDARESNDTGDGKDAKSGKSTKETKSAKESKEIRETKGGGGTRYVLDQDPQVEGAMVVIDPYTGQVKAVVGGYSFERSQFDRATQGRRQPGSAIKPLLYSAAFNRGYGPNSVVLDAPISFPGGPGGKRWSPKNAGGRYHGPTQLKNALVMSLNTVSVRLVHEIGLDYTRDFLGRLNFTRPFPRHLALALGAVEVTPLELTAAYGIFPTLGKRFEPIFITEVTDGEGHPVEFGNTRPQFERVLPAEKAYQMVGMMEGVVQRGTGRRAQQKGRPVAGKTGTTNDNRDAWFVGYTPDLIAGVWVGYDSGRSLGHYDEGGVAAAPIWGDFMHHALEGRPVIDFPVPSGVTVASLYEGEDRPRRKHRASHPRVARRRELSPESDAPGVGGDL